MDRETWKVTSSWGHKRVRNDLATKQQQQFTTEKLDKHYLKPGNQGNINSDISC